MFGRKRTLIAASLFLCAAYILFLQANSFNMFAIAQMLLAAGIAFNSGTDTSFLLETTQALGVQDEYGAREANATRFNFLGTAVAAVLGGLAAIPDFRGAYVLSFVGAVGLLAITIRFTEPLPANPSSKTPRVGFIKQIVSCVGLLRNIRLLWLSVFAVFMIVMNHIPYEFYQPFVKELAREYEIMKATPFLTSLHLALTMVVAAWIASKSIQIRDRIGTGATLISAAGLQLAMVAVMYFFVNIPAAIATLLRSCPRALMTAPLNAAVAPNVPTSMRATFLSLQSLFGRLGFASTLAFFAYAVGGDEWASITNMLQWGMWMGIVGLAALIMTSPVVRGE
jgi:MFS family permease